MAKDFYSVGYEEIDNDLEERRRREEDFGKGIRPFWMKKDEEAPMRFLTEDPLTVLRHSCYINGKWKDVTCEGDETVCPLCLIEVKKSRKAAYLVLDRRVFPSNDGKKEYTNEVKVMTLGTTQVGAVKKAQEKDPKKSLLREWTICRVGEGIGTQYLPYPNDAVEFTKDEIAHVKENLLEYKADWEKFKEASGREIKLEHFVVLSFLKPLPTEELKKIAAKIAVAKPKEATEFPDDGEDDENFSF